MHKFWKSGDPFIWLSGVALMFSSPHDRRSHFLIAAKGLGFFWPSDVAVLGLKDGTSVMGVITGHENVKGYNAATRCPSIYRTQVKIGNRDLYGLDFKWVDDDQIVKTTYPKFAVVLERREWGNMYGFIKEVSESGTIICTGNEECWPVLAGQIPQYARRSPMK